jgi:predicted adenine nucleotide alpha hydrolase (AANH) superfamily ATPase
MSDIGSNDGRSDIGSNSGGCLNLLMHVCCGPCAAWPVKKLTEGGRINLTALFYNPNIHPMDEFTRRREGAITLARHMSIPIVVYDDYMQTEWEEWEECKTYDNENFSRCRMCYDIRLDFTARKAIEDGFDAFTTSLLISPYQKHDLIKELGVKYQEKYGVRFYYEDFRPAFREGQGIAREIGLYRQKYCGCILSRNNSPEEKTSSN